MYTIADRSHGRPDGRSGRAELDDRHAPTDSFNDFIVDATTGLRRALVARYGVELGVEATAEAIARAWANRDRLLAMDNPKGYLYRVGQTAVRTQTRPGRLPDLPAEQPAPGDPASHPALESALTTLTEHQRTAVLLVHAHGYPYAEAAALLDMPVSTLKNHLHRGLAALRRALEASR